MNIFNTFLGLMLVSLIPLALIITFRKLDKEYREIYKANKFDIIIIIAFAIIYSIITPITITNTIQYINFSILMGYLVFMSYTDQKSKLLYTSVSIFMIIYEAIMVIINYKHIVSVPYIWTVAFIPIGFFILSLFRMIGLGDVFIYVVICLYYAQYRTVPTLSMIYNILLTNIMFVVVTIIIMIIKKDRKRYNPLTIFIAISTYICGILLI